jgi:short-subunit dehydrogenase
MKALDFKDRLAVVTGASSGLGREIARALAVREGAHIIAAARRRDRLEELKAEIQAQCPSRVYVLPVDLGTPEGAQTLFREATSLGEVYALVNCAGLTFYGRTLDAPMEKFEQIISVNLLSEMRASMLFLRYFLEQGRGAILTVTSVAAFLPAPFQNAYAATKHGMQAFMEGLAREYTGRGVAICTFVPGGLATEMNTLSGLDRKFGKENRVNMDPARAARKALAAFKRGKPSYVPGLMYKAVVFLVRLFPRATVAWVMEKFYAP